MKVATALFSLLPAWKGTVSELRRLVERACLFGRSDLREPNLPTSCVLPGGSKEDGRWPASHQIFPATCGGFNDVSNGGGAH